MVFILEDLAELEKDRRIIYSNTKEHTYVQTPEFCDEIIRLRDDNRKSVGQISRAIESSLEDYIEFKQYYVWGKSINGVLDVFQDAFINAAMWGNQAVPGKIIDVKFKYGLYGSVVLVGDKGDGFDYQSRILSLQECKGHDSEHQGMGMKKFHNSGFFFAYHSNGSLLSIATKIFSREEYYKFQHESYLI
ncbi:MAG: hypothetical protein KAS15_01685 [Nanoarchaeota archaeon]|nr:hypothetical protein [Nanoarchaeota archaeon]MCK5628993.1 hypothetical protein [Nanoarchaeota archaeon]